MDEKIFNKGIITLCKRLSTTKNSWAITGGANHFLRSIVKNINDIDIITSKEGGAEIATVLSNYTVKPYKHTVSEKIKSHYGVINYKGIIIEIMADPINYIENEWVTNSSWKKSIENVKIRNCTLPLTTLDYEIEIYELLNNTERLDLLKEYKLLNLK